MEREGQNVDMIAESDSEDSECELGAVGGVDFQGPNGGDLPWDDDDFAPVSFNEADQIPAENQTIRLRSNDIKSY